MVTSNMKVCQRAPSLKILLNYGKHERQAKENVLEKTYGMLPPLRIFDGTLHKRSAQVGGEESMERIRRNKINEEGKE